MDLNAFNADRSQRRVLSHETTHVLQAVESDRALARNYAAAKFFIEGMAQYTSFEVVPETERRDSNQQLAAVSWKRQNIEFTDLIDEAGFAERFDAELHYSLGDLWTQAYVDICGEPALGEFLRAAGRDTAVSDLAPAIFWRDTTGFIDCDLDTVNEHWRTQMDALYDSVQAERFPMYTGIVVKDDADSDQIVVTASMAPYIADDELLGEAALPDVSQEGNSGCRHAIAIHYQSRFRHNAYIWRGSRVSWSACPAGWRQFGAVHDPPIRG